MSDQDGDKPLVSWGWLYAGLTVAALSQVLLIVMYFTGELDTSVPPIGSFTALPIVLGSAWLIRQRQKGRL